MPETSEDIKVTVIHFSTGQKEVSLNGNRKLKFALKEAGHDEIPNEHHVMVNVEDVPKEEFGNVDLEDEDVITIMGNVSGG